MIISEQIGKDLQKLFQAAVNEDLSGDIYKDICEHLKVAKMYYDMDLGGEGRYRDPRTGNLVMAERESDNMIILYDNGEATDLKMVYPYYYNGYEYVHAYIEFYEGVKKEELDLELFQFIGDIVYLLASRRNMRLMLDFAEVVDAMTGIPNVTAIHREFERVTKEVPAHELLVMRINLQNFRYINDVAGAKCGDEAIVTYSHRLIMFIGKNEGVCRLGGDNFALFIKKEHFSDMLDKINSVVLDDLKKAPGRRFEIRAWVGVSEMRPGEHKPFGARLTEASIACDMAKGLLKKEVVFYNDELAHMINRGHQVMAMFRPAIKDHEFLPFFQAKVDMRTGELVGFEALCRWIHEGSFIYPDQFIPVLDREGVIPELDIAMFSETCMAIRKWKDMGLNPPRISSNFSKKDLFVPHIEDRILDIIRNNGLETDDLEVEITESVKESEYDRLIEFVKRLKADGLHIAVDDFGTGYSSLSLIHNIDGDIIKIDKSFINMLPDDKKASALIESIIEIAGRLNMSTIAEGVETAEQGAALLQLGCYMAQGYYYSKPVDFETATNIIRNPEFKPIVNMDETL